MPKYGVFYNFDNSSFLIEVDADNKDQAVKKIKKKMSKTKEITLYASDDGFPINIIKVEEVKNANDFN